MNTTFMLAVRRTWASMPSVEYTEEMEMKAGGLAYPMASCFTLMWWNGLNGIPSGNWTENPASRMGRLLFKKPTVPAVEAPLSTCLKSKEGLRQLTDLSNQVSLHRLLCLNDVLVDSE
jgi:hypothetical protein